MARKSIKIKKRCLFCNKEFIKQPNEIENNRGYFCSRKCSGKYYIKNKARNWKGGKPHCLDCNKELSYGAKYCSTHAHTKERYGKNYKGGAPKCIDCNKQLKNWYAKRCLSCNGINHRKEKSHLWKGGTNNERHWLMTKSEYILWRTAVFTRDNYTCQKCGIKGKYMEADHIKPWALYPELRFAIDNGRTLCRPCHMKTETWGYKKIYKQIQ